MEGAPFSRSGNSPQGAEGTQESQDPENPQDLGSPRRSHGHHNVNDGHEDQEAIQNVPAAAQVSLFPEVQAQGDHLGADDENVTLSSRLGHGPE